MFDLRDLLIHPKLFRKRRKSPFPPGPCEPDLPLDPEPVKPPEPVCETAPKLRTPSGKKKRKR